MRKKPLTQDAKILLQLNRLRKEAEMREGSSIPEAIARADWQSGFHGESREVYSQIPRASNLNRKHNV
jgi:hypothetical protein